MLFFSKQAHNYSSQHHNSRPAFDMMLQLKYWLQRHRLYHQHLYVRHTRTHILICWWWWQSSFHCSWHLVTATSMHGECLPFAHRTKLAPWYITIITSLWTDWILQSHVLLLCGQLVCRYTAWRNLWQWPDICTWILSLNRQWHHLWPVQWGSRNCLWREWLLNCRRQTLSGTVASTIFWLQKYRDTASCGWFIVPKFVRWYSNFA